MFQVEYGADLHTMDHGSGFPTGQMIGDPSGNEMEYAKSPWNLNNMPNLENSVLGYINVDISGKQVLEYLKPLAPTFQNITQKPIYLSQVHFHFE